MNTISNERFEDIGHYVGWHYEKAKEISEAQDIPLDDVLKLIRNFELSNLHETLQEQRDEMRETNQNLIFLSDAIKGR